MHWLRKIPSPIDGKFVLHNFHVEGIDGYAKNPDPEAEMDIPGCPQIKNFTLFEGSYPTQIAIALCTDGDYGPKSIQSTIEKQVEESKKEISRMAPEFSKAMLSGLPGISVHSQGGREGKALTIPMVGHGIGVVPTAYRIDAVNKNVIFIQVFADQEKVRDLNPPTAALLKAVDDRLQK